MARYIDADKIYERIAEKEELARQRVIDTPSRLPNGDFNPYATRYATQLDERTNFKFMIADAPTIEAESVKHGRWIRKESKRFYWFECSECGYPPPLDKFKREWFSNYCPNCGAKMDEVEDE